MLTFHFCFVFFPTKSETSPSPYDKLWVGFLCSVANTINVRFSIICYEILLNYLFSSFLSCWSGKKKRMKKKGKGVYGGRHLISNKMRFFGWFDPGFFSFVDPKKNSSSCTISILENYWQEGFCCGVSEKEKLFSRVLAQHTFLQNIVIRKKKVLNYFFINLRVFASKFYMYKKLYKYDI